MLVSLSIHDTDHSVLIDFTEVVNHLLVVIDHASRVNTTVFDHTQL